jgi:hypothetical protein
MGPELFGISLGVRSKQAETCEGLSRFVWGFLEDDLPATGGASGDVFGAIVEVEDIGAAVAAGFLDDFVEGGVGFHDAVFVGENIAVEIGEEWKIAANMADCEVVGVREDVGGQARLSKGGVDLDHFRNFEEDVGEAVAEFFDGAFEACGGDNKVEKLASVDAAGFVFEQKGGAVNGFADFVEGTGSLRGDTASGDPVIEVYEDFAEVENDGFGKWHSVARHEFH